MAYVDGYVLAVPKKNVKAYRRMATLGAKIWMHHGALDYRECVLDDAKAPFCMNFPKVMKAKPSETVFFSYVVFKSRAHRDRVNAKVMKDPRMQGIDPSEMPLDPKRMVYGGFRALVEG